MGGGLASRRASFHAGPGASNWTVLTPGSTYTVQFSAPIGGSTGQSDWE